MKIMKSKWYIGVKEYNGISRLIERDNNYYEGVFSSSNENFLVVGVVDEKKIMLIQLFDSYNKPSLLIDSTLIDSSSKSTYYEGVVAFIEADRSYDVGKTFIETTNYNASLDEIALLNKLVSNKKSTLLDINKEKYINAMLLLNKMDKDFIAKTKLI